MIELRGTELAETIKKQLKEELARRPDPLRLAIVIVGKNPVSERFVQLKEHFAKDVGIETRRYEFDEHITTNTLRERMKAIVHETHNDGVIVQLPLPGHIDAQSILNTVVPEKDVDVLSARAVGNVEVGKSQVEPPITRAIEALFKKYNIEVNGKRAAVIGGGKLVGKPAAGWLGRQGAIVTSIRTKEQFDQHILKNAEIIISGIGVPRSITGEYIQSGAVVVDCGTSELAGELVGDVDTVSVAAKAGFLTPLRGGVGPLTVAYVFQNLFDLKK